MSLPGFTAEASAYKTSNSYYGISRTFTSGDSSTVFAQQSSCLRLGDNCSTLVGPPCCGESRCSGVFGICEDPIRPNPPTMPPPRPDCAERGQFCDPNQRLFCCDSFCIENECL